MKNPLCQLPGCLLAPNDPIHTRKSSRGYHIFVEANAGEPELGPWRYGALSEEIITADGRAIASPPENFDEDEWHKHAPLLAAAPDLLKQLEALVVQIKHAGLIVPPGVTAAIAKARGRKMSR